MIYSVAKVLETAAKKQGRVAQEGLIGAYVHTDGKIGVLVEVNCETDFVARTDEFRYLVKELTLQVAAQAPRWVAPENVPEEIKKKEEEIYREQLKTATNRKKSSKNCRRKDEKVFLRKIVF